MRRPGTWVRRAVVGCAVATMVAAPACGSSESGTKPKGNASISIKTFKFTPERITLPVDSELRVLNEDTTPHTLTADDMSFDTGNIAVGKEAVVKLSKEGEFAYHCAIHSSMRGVILVRP